MICDAHVHVGYFPRKDGRGGESYYFSPRRIVGILHRSGIGEFIFSSTNVFWDDTAEVMHSEAREVKRICGRSAHPFFWVSNRYLRHDRNLERLPEIYEGLKLHGGESAWLDNPRGFRRVLSIASERRWPVQIHTSADFQNHVSRYLPYCKDFPWVNFDMAHVREVELATNIVQKFDNVFMDVSFLPVSLARQIIDVAPLRVLFGSDIPAPMKYSKRSLGVYIRKMLEGLSDYPQEIFNKNFRAFLRQDGAYDA